jgi:hypothetical protein
MANIAMHEYRYVQISLCANIAMREYRCADIAMHCRNAWRPPPAASLVAVARLQGNRINNYSATCCTIKSK